MASRPSRDAVADRQVLEADHEGRADPLRLGRALDFVNRRLGESNYLAGDELTAADIMIVFSLTTMRTFTSYDLKPYPHILAYLRRIGAREAYQRAMRKGDPGMTPMLE